MELGYSRPGHLRHAIACTCLGANLNQSRGVIDSTTHEFEFLINSASKMDFKVQGTWSSEKYCWPLWLADMRSFLILDALEWLKQ